VFTASVMALIPSVSTFQELAKEGKIVDKSSAILEFLRSPKPSHLLLGPRRSGKSTLLSTFQ
jgi:predicted AAA+ superfamily ATPase